MSNRVKVDLVMPRKSLRKVLFSRKKKEIMLPKVVYKGSSYYVVSPSLILSMDLEGYPVYLKSRVMDKPKITFRRPLPVFGGEHEHVVVFGIEGGLTVIFHGIAFVAQGEIIDIYGIVRDNKQIIATAIITEKAEYSTQF